MTAPQPFELRPANTRRADMGRGVLVDAYPGSNDSLELIHSFIGKPANTLNLAIIFTTNLRPLGL